MAKIYAIEGVIPVIHPSSFVHPEAVIIGDVRIAENCFIGPFACLRGDFGIVDIHAGANIQDHCMLHSFPDKAVTVETLGHVGHGAVLHGCTVKRNALVGINATVMDGAVIGEEAFVGGNAFVRADFEVPARHLASGVPAKVIRELEQREIDWKSKGTLQYQELAQRYHQSLTPVAPLTELESNRPKVSWSSDDSIALHQLKKSES